MVKNPGTLKQIINTLFPILSVDQYRTVNRSTLFIRLNASGKASIVIELERDKKRISGTVKNPIYNWNWIEIKILQNLMGQEIIDLIKRKWEDDNIS